MALRATRVDVRIRHLAGEGGTLAEDTFECWDVEVEDLSETLEADGDFLVLEKVDGTHAYYRRDQIISVMVTPN
jgi:hypothetical protein